jgi:hypothetical protein
MDTVGTRDGRRIGRSVPEVSAIKQGSGGDPVVERVVLCAARLKPRVEVKVEGGWRYRQFAHHEHRVNSNTVSLPMDFSTKLTTI